MSRFRSFVIRFGAPLVLVAGVAGAFAARRAVILKHSMELWADSLKLGSGPLTLEVPFVPAYLEGRKIGSLKSVRLERHEPRTVDSLRLVIGLSREAVNDPGVRGCTFELVTFDPGEFKRALECAPDTAGLVPFGRVAFEQGGEATLYVATTELACAPWTDDKDRGECIGARVRRDVQRDLQRVREEMRRLPGREGR
jgi:hypothetical protein